MQKIIHVTDLHLRTPGQNVLGIDPVSRLEMVIASINLWHADADLCVMTGDLADLGEPEAYVLLRNALAELIPPTWLTLGNHDSRAGFARAFPEIGLDDHGFVQGTAVIGDRVILLLDTLDDGHAARGVLCEDRLEWLDIHLKIAGDRSIVIFMHHPPRSIGFPWFDNMLLANGSDLMERLQKRQGSAHVAFGHVHVNISGSWDNISFSGSRGLCHKILFNPNVMRADYVDHGPAYDVLLFDNDSLLVCSVDPADPPALIAREYPTEDGKGRFELFE